MADNFDLLATYSGSIAKSVQALLAGRIRVMQHRLTIKHLGGSKVNRTDRVSLPREREIIFGRDPECNVRYDEADDLVSRKHLKIVATDEQPVRYMVVDFGSRNGTFVNRQRVFGAVLLLPGGRVQLGAGGPEFEFLPETEETRRPPGAYSRIASIRGFRQALIVFLLCVVGTGGYVGWSRVAPLWRERQNARPPRVAKPKFDPVVALASVAGIEAHWSLIDSQTGVHLALAYISNESSGRSPLVEGPFNALPVFILGEDRRIEPLLVPVGTAHSGQALGGRWKSKGAIVSESGAVLTTAPLLLPWKIAGQGTVEAAAGALLVLDSMRITHVVPLAVTQFPRWMPTESGFLVDQLPENFQGIVRGRRVSKGDLRVEVTASINVAGRTQEAKLVPESSGLWFSALQPVSRFAGLRVAPLADEVTRPKDRQPVWVVGDQIEAGAIKHAPTEGSVAIKASHCSEGGVVFDQEGRALALCVPDSQAKGGDGIAVPIHRDREFPDGAAGGHDW